MFVFIAKNEIAKKKHNQDFKSKLNNLLHGKILLVYVKNDRLTIRRYTVNSITVIE